MFANTGGRKRPAEDDYSEDVIIEDERDEDEIEKEINESASKLMSKKPKNESSNGTLVPVNNKNNQLISTGKIVGKRTSSLLAPIMLLEGHQSDILCTRFSPKTGELLASAGSERTPFLWKTYGECTNTLLNPTHQGTITDLEFTADGSLLLTSSIDKTVGVYDVQSGQRIKRMKGHTNFVNSVGENKKNQPLVVSGSDDSQVKVWDLRRRGNVISLNNVYQVTAVCFGEQSEQVISGGIDNEIKVWDLRKADVSLKINGHTDTITDLRLSADGGYVLSNSMDGTLRIFDIKPFASGQRCTKIYDGHTHGYEKYLLKCSWSADGQRIASGSSDRFVYVWDTNTRQLQYRLPGHNGTVTAVDLHPDEPIVLSGSVDKQLYLGELDIN